MIIPAIETPPFCSYSCNWNSSPSLRHVAAFFIGNFIGREFIFSIKERIYPPFFKRDETAFMTTFILSDINYSRSSPI